MSFPDQDCQNLEHYRQIDRCDQMHYNAAFTDGKKFTAYSSYEV